MQDINTLEISIKHYSFSGSELNLSYAESCLSHTCPMSSGVLGCEENFISNTGTQGHGHQFNQSGQSSSTLDQSCNVPLRGPERVHQINEQSRR